MGSTLQDDMFTANVIVDPYSYYGRLRDEDPVHWNERYELWVVTRHDDLVWMSRHPRAVLVRCLQERPATGLSGNR